MVLNTKLFSILLAEVFLGVGSVAANEKDSDDGSNGPGRVVADAWTQLLNKDEDGVYSLKPWDEVKDAVKEDLGKAMREYMRQTWGKWIYNTQSISL